MSQRLFKRANGDFAVASCNSKWLSIGQNVPEPMTAKEALSATGMDAMRLSEHPVKTTVDGFTDADGQVMLSQNLSYPKHKAIVLEEVVEGRLTPVDVVGANREVFQFEELIEPLERVIDVSEAMIETFALTANGAEWFAFLKLPREVTIGGDKHAAYLCGRDGLRRSFSVAGLWERLWCSNQFPSALVRAGKEGVRYTLQHRRGAYVSVSAIRHRIDLTYAAAEEFDEAAKHFLSSSMEMAEMLTYADEVLGGLEPGASARAKTNHRKRNAQLRNIFMSDSVATTYRNGKPTEWTAFQTVSEWLDHQSPVRATDKDARRMERLAFGSFDKTKRDLLEALR